MKKILLFAMISLLFIGCCPSQSQQIENKGDAETVGEFYYHFLRARVHGYVDKIEYEGHTFLIFTDGSGLAVTHDPNCECNKNKNKQETLFDW